MYSRIPLFCLLLVQAQIASSSATFESVGHAVQRVHSAAVKRSAHLARDLRLVLNGLLVQQPEQGPDNRVYCTTTNDPTGGGTDADGGGGAGGNVTSPIGGNGTTPSSGGGGSNGTGTVPSGGGSSTWKVAEQHAGSSFFDGWVFFNQADPTHGTVQYVDQPTAQSSNLTSITSQNSAIMRVDTTPQVSNARMSVRITTSSIWTGGLFILDAVHMPIGCATWPAFWTDGPNWPTGGEIDIIEGVNVATINQMTLHTAPGCQLPSSSPATLGMTGTLSSSTNCAAAETGNAGCGVQASGPKSYGAAFNQNGGGVYAMLWQDSGISVYFFPRGQIPSDISANAPEPQNWGLPQGNWPSGPSCNISQFFYQHSVIFDTTLCGDWAGQVWTDNANTPGQTESCAQSTGFATCSDFVLGSGASFSEAYWEVNSVTIYQQQN